MKICTNYLPFIDFVFVV